MTICSRFLLLLKMDIVWLRKLNLATSIAELTYVDGIRFLWCVLFIVMNDSYTSIGYPEASGCYAPVVAWLEFYMEYFDFRTSSGGTQTGDIEYWLIENQGDPHH